MATLALGCGAMFVSAAVAAATNSPGATYACGGSVFAVIIVLAVVVGMFTRDDDSEA